jgi:hypothetical protein
MEPRLLLARAALVFTLPVLTACRDASTSRALASARPGNSPTAIPPPPASSKPQATSSTLPPLGGEWLVRLPLEGFGDAVVSVPLGATSPRSVVLGVHGRNDRPEWACGEWRGVTDAHPFILCPHGTPVKAAPGQGLAFSGAERTRREIEAGIEALRARFGPYVAEGPMIYAGFSLGAILGVAIVADEPARFPIAVLGEGGQREWTSERAARFARGGGSRVLFVCSTWACEAAAPPALAALRGAGVEAKMISAGHIGHLVDDRVVAAVRGAWPWVASGAMAAPSRD